MPKEQRDGRAKVRVFFAEVDGNDGTIQEGLRSLATTLVCAMQPQASARVAKLLPAAHGNGTTTDPPTLFDQAPVTSEDAAGAAEEDFMEVDPDIAEPTPSKATRQKKSPSYTFVGDLNLRPTDQVHLKDFFKQKNPSGQQEQMTVFLHYLTRTLGLTGITVNHVCTCFNEVVMKVPKDILQIARNTAHRKGWNDVSDPKNLRTTTQGDNFVTHDLPNECAS